MMYLLFIATFLTGIVIRWTVIHLPTKLHQSWTKECLEYLQNKEPGKAFDNTPEIISTTKIKWWHYLPLSSFFWKDKRITFSHKFSFLILDLTLFISSFFIFHQFDTYLYWGGGLLFTWLLITSSFIDFEHQILPDELTYIILWIGLSLSCLNIFTYSTSAILGALIAYSSLFTISFLFKLIRKKEGIGQGDLKFFAAIAAWVGVMQLPLVLFLASLLSLLFIILRKVIKGDSCATPMSFGPFLAFSGWLVLLWGNTFSSYIQF